MGLLADALDVVAAMIRFQMLRVKQRLNASVNACMLAAVGVGTLMVSLSYLLWGVHAWSFRAVGPAAAHFLTAAAAVIATAVLAFSAVLILRQGQRT